MYVPEGSMLLAVAVTLRDGQQQLLLPHLQVLPLAASYIQALHPNHCNPPSLTTRYGHRVGNTAA